MLLQRHAPSRPRRPSTPRLLLGLLLPLFAAHAHAGGGDDHSHEPAPVVGSGKGAPRIAVQSELYQAVGVLKDGRLLVYLDGNDDNEPVRDATLTVTLGDEAAEAKATDAGTYMVSSPRLLGHGPLEVIFNVGGARGEDLLIGTLPLPEDDHHDSGVAQTSGAGALLSQFGSTKAAGFAIFAGGLALGLGLAASSTRRATLAVVGVALVLFTGIAFAGGGDDHTHDAPPAMPGTDTPQRLPNGSIYLPKPSQRVLEIRTSVATTSTVEGTVRLVGKVIPDPNRGGLVQSINGGRIVAPEGGLPHLGKTVRKGEVLALVERPIIQADQATVLERMRDIEQQISLAEARLTRARRLAETGASTRVAVTDTELEIEGLRRRLTTMDDIRTRPEVLVSPADGVIASTRVAAGQVVGPQDVLFQVIDPKSLWVEAISFDPLSPAREANASTASGERLRLRVVGISRALQQQATVIHFAVVEPPAGLHLGEPVTVHGKTGTSLTGIIVPRAAVVRSASGEALVWHRADPERFEPRTVRVEPLDAGNLVLRSGVTEGDRIVVRGADLIGQIR